MPNYQHNDQINDEFNTDLLLDQIFEEEEDIMYGISDYDYNHNQPQTNINHQYYPRQDKQHYIGLPFHIQGRQELIMSGTVHPQTFYKYSGQDIERYLFESRCYEDPNAFITYNNNGHNSHNGHNNTVPKAEIMQLHMLADGTYSVVLKTHWLRILQRRWRRIYNGRLGQ